ncbi:hypothetical protein PHYSODRAFT_420879, partial [Phytophthora sojae]
AAAGGHTTFLRWLRNQGVVACWGKVAVARAVRSGQVDTLNFLLHEVTAPFDNRSLSQAAHRRNPHALWWLLANTSLRPDNRALVAACEAGRLANLQLLAPQVAGRHSDCATQAATYGHLDIMKWLHRHGFAFTRELMNGAAIVQWLHQHRNEGCTHDAIDYAVHHGHTEVAQWLLQYRTEGCSNWAMQLAIVGGHLGAAQWLHQNVEMRWTGPLLDLAA